MLLTFHLEHIDNNKINLFLQFIVDSNVTSNLKSVFLCMQG